MLAAMLHCEGMTRPGLRIAGGYTFKTLLKASWYTDLWVSMSFEKLTHGEERELLKITEAVIRALAREIPKRREALSD
jgi:hypothetical protein